MTGTIIIILELNINHISIIMKLHTSIYMVYFDLRESDYIYSEISGLPCNDIHHINNKGMGGSKSKDYIENLIALTREEHELCHRYKIVNDFAKVIHNKFLKYNPYKYPDDINYFNNIFKLNIEKIKSLV